MIFLVAPVPGAFADLNLTATSGAFPDASPGAVFDAAVAGSLIATPPITMDAIPVGPSGSLQDAINAASDGDTISLTPGTYRVHDLVILNKNLIFAANTSLGGNRDNTILDAEGQGRIFDVRDDSSLILLNLTLQNGRVIGNGGAVNSSGNLGISDSAITGCSAGGDGGAVNTTGGVEIFYSTITGCSSGGNGGVINAGDQVTIGYLSVTGCTAGGNGGIINAEDGVIIVNSTVTGCGAGGDGGAVSSDSLVYIVYTTVTGCTAGGNGGAVASQASFTTMVWIQQSTIYDCHATGGNGGAVYSSSVVAVLGSAITGCSAGGSGGAVYSASYGAAVSESTITGCSAGSGNGGGVCSIGQIFQMDDSTITGCSAGGNGGGVYSEVSNPLQPNMGLIFFSSAITDCNAGGSGGALHSINTAPSIIMSSTFTGSHSSAPGGAIWSSSPAASMNFSRIYGNSAPAVYSYAGPFIAENNWWGSNANPSGSVGSLSGTVDYDPWLVLSMSASPSSLTVGQFARIRANLTNNTDITDTYPEGRYVPDGIVNRFSATGAGTVSPASAGTVDGGAGTGFSTNGAGVATVCDTVDDQTVCVPVTVSYPPATLSPENDDDNLPGVTPVPTGSPLTVLPMTVTVNIGGDSAAGRATVTGTKLSGLVVTGTVEPGPGTNLTAPPGIVYQYISLVPAGYGSIDNAVINFTVPGSWLDEHRIVPSGIILYHQTAGGWEELPTTNLYAKDGRVHYSAVSPALSLFAIAGTPETAAVATMATTPAISSSPEIEQVTVRTPVQEATQAPVAIETTGAPPTAEAPAGSSVFPVMPAVLGVCCVGLIGGGFVARRWWLRQQNPALFRDYE